MRFEEVLPAMRDSGAAIQRASQPVKWAYLKRSPNGAYHWYGFGDDPMRASPANLTDDHFDADDWQIVDPAAVAALKPEATFNCPRRSEGFRSAPAGALLDYWRENAHNTEGGKHSCSYCGSIKPDEFMQAARDGVEIGPTDKSYKAYMRGPGFNHAKFYFQHLDESQKREFVDMLNAKTMKIGEPGYFYSKPFFVTYDQPAEA